MTSTAYVQINGVKLREGDEAAIRTSYGSSEEYKFVRVKRITPTGQIVAMAGMVEYRFNERGREKGGPNLHGQWLVPVTDEIRVSIMRRRITYYKWDKASDATIMDVARLLGLATKE